MPVSRQQNPKIKLVENEEPMGVTGFTDKEESDVDVALNLQAESQRGK